MARVDFGVVNPPLHERGAVEQCAAALPPDWTVTFRTQPRSSRTMSVVVGGDRFDYKRDFDLDRFDLVQEFLELIVRHRGRSE